MRGLGDVMGREKRGHKIIYISFYGDEVLEISSNGLTMREFVRVYLIPAMKEKLREIGKEPKEYSISFKNHYNGDCVHDEDSFPDIYQPQVRDFDLSSLFIIS